MLMAWPEGAMKGAAEVGKILSRWVSCFESGFEVHMKLTPRRR